MSRTLKKPQKRWPTRMAALTLLLCGPTWLAALPLSAARAAGPDAATDTGLAVTGGGNGTVTTATTPTGSTTTPSPSPSPSALPKGCEGPINSEQKKKYCDAAKSATEAAKANQKLTAVWGGVTAVCTVACAVSFGDSNPYAIPLRYACMGTNLAGSVTDVFMNKDLTSRIMGAVGAGLSGFDIAKTAGLIEGPSLGLGETGKFLDQHATCITAAFAGMKVYTNSSGADENRRTAKENRENAARLDTLGQSVSTVLATTGGTSNTGSGSLVGVNGTGVAGLGATGAGSNTDSASTATNITSCAGGDAASTVSCAMASDKQLPDSVNSPEFSDAIKKLSGLDMPEFLERAGKDPTGAITQALNGSLGPERTGKMGELLAGLESSYAVDGGAAYAGGGGSRGGSGGGPEMPDFGLLMGKMGGDAGGNAGPGTLQFNGAAGVKRDLASVTAEDRNVSIFERVTYRYSLVKDRVGAAGTGY